MERLFQLGGILLLIGAILPIFLSQEKFIYAAIVYTVGAIPFAIVQFCQHYKGQDIVIRRLRRQQVSGAILLLVTAALMFTEYFHLRPLTGDLWKLSLCIAAIFEVYSAFRLASLNKE
ncbi:hypothetical protein HMPREF9332_00491 [Alloprevotella rava F0323]|uniref:Uncharacterized protein n=1 Tax=Alloprevotella rava F0323 TaxID=679199 RepID=G5GA90_9BACT|nr:hypothetical protein [Alloprevotella rava]EHG24290.1 hypothetical protein HMPREF9332_00491 [Alloprevotella rava F0323]